MIELKKHVEKAVRPVRTWRDRKLKMREELLAHLTGIYDEEFTRLNDHDAAAQAAIERFGSAEEISRNLQASIPWRVQIVWYIFGGDHENTIWQATLWACRLALLTMIVAGIPWVVMRVVSGDWQPAEATKLWFLFTLYGFAMLATEIRFLAYHCGFLGTALSVPRSIVWGFLTWCAFVSLPALFLSTDWIGPSIREKFFGNDEKFLMIAAICAGLVMLTAVLAKTKTMSKHLRTVADLEDQHRQWLELELSE